ncbi:hypothetical protein QLX55_02145 [Solobacterium moorei]|nr:hypothetical protein [Solobacterium moorei]MDI6414129.1 hypothetical protein [Solobacterium moorei]
MKLRELFKKRVEVIACNDLIIIGKVIDYYPAKGTESGEDEIDIFLMGEI